MLRLPLVDEPFQLGCEAEAALTENFFDAVATDGRGGGRSRKGRAGFPSGFVYRLVRVLLRSFCAPRASFSGRVEVMPSSGSDPAYVPVRVVQGPQDPCFPLRLSQAFSTRFGECASRAG
jgi:hypothetical protein